MAEILPAETWSPVVLLACPRRHLAVRNDVWFDEFECAPALALASASAPPLKADRIATQICPDVGLREPAIAPSQGWAEQIRSRGSGDGRGRRTTSSLALVPAVRTPITSVRASLVASAHANPVIARDVMPIQTRQASRDAGKETWRLPRCLTKTSLGTVSQTPVPGIFGLRLQRLVITGTVPGGSLP